MAFTAMELFAKLAVNKDDFDKGMDDAVGTAESAASKIGKGVAVAGAAAGAAVGFVATKVADLTVQSVQAYGEYEQLTGGIEKLYGDAADAMVQHASEAFATTGMDANTYMQGVTSFSAALINSLDGDVEAATEIADMAMRDLSDNANVFGVQTAEELTSVYTNLARGQFQLLDSLNLGYAGTQDGMLQLLNDSGLFEEQLESLDGIRFDQMLQAIHEVQTQMNITGTTENEAAGTIQGSINMLQASWTNLVTGMADSNADLGSLIGNVVESARAVIDNVIPAASQALSGIATLIEQVAPMITAELPGLIDTILPPILNAAIEITTALVSALPTIISAISRAIPMALNQLIPAIISITPQLLAVGGELLMGLIQGITDNIDAIIGAITDVVILISATMLTPENIEKFIMATTTMILAVANALLENAPIILGAVVEVLANVFIALSESLPDIIDYIVVFVKNLGDTLGEELWDVFGDSAVIFAEGIQNIWNIIRDAVSMIGQNLSDSFNNEISAVSDFIGYIVDLFSMGSIEDAVNSVLNDVLAVFGQIFDDIKGVVTDAVNFLLDAFDFDWQLPEIKLPHFSVSGGEAPWGFGGYGTMPNVSVEWYKKAYDQPYLLEDATIFGAHGGKLLGGGEGNGSEIVMGYSQLLEAIKEATNTTVIVPVYIGGEQIDEFVVQSNQRNDFISGGRG